MSIRYRLRDGARVRPPWRRGPCDDARPIGRSSASRRGRARIVARCHSRARRHRWHRDTRCRRRHRRRTRWHRRAREQVGIGFVEAIEEADEARARLAWETNFWGPIHLCQAVLPYIRAQRAGVIINLSTVGAGFPGGGWLAMYAATKQA